MTNIYSQKRLLKMENKPPIRLKTISEFHKSHDLAQPEHPLISVIDFGSVPRTADISTKSWAFDFYQVSLKRGIDFKMKYGQQAYDFDEGVMGFIVPNQVFRIAPRSAQVHSGWMLLVHPDFLWNTPSMRPYFYQKKKKPH
jgi:hypothetical protein